MKIQMFAVLVIALSIFSGIAGASSCTINASKFAHPGEVTEVQAMLNGVAVSPSWSRKSGVKWIAIKNGGVVYVQGTKVTFKRSGLYRALVNERKTVRCRALTQVVDPLILMRPTLNNMVKVDFTQVGKVWAKKFGLVTRVCIGGSCSQAGTIQSGFLVPASAGVLTVDFVKKGHAKKVSFSSKSAMQLQGLNGVNIAPSGVITVVSTQSTNTTPDPVKPAPTTPVVKTPVAVIPTPYVLSNTSGGFTLSGIVTQNFFGFTCSASEAWIIWQGQVAGYPVGDDGVITDAELAAYPYKGHVVGQYDGTGSTTVFAPNDTGSFGIVCGGKHFWANTASGVLGLASGASRVGDQLQLTLQNPSQPPVAKGVITKTGSQLLIEFKIASFGNRVVAPLTGAVTSYKAVCHWDEVFWNNPVSAPINVNALGNLEAIVSLVDVNGAPYTGTFTGNCTIMPVAGGAETYFNLDNWQGVNISLK